MREFSELVHEYWKSQMIQGEIIHFDELFTLVSNPNLVESCKIMILEMTNMHTMAVATPLVTEKMSLKSLSDYSAQSFREAILKFELTLHAPDNIYYLPYNRVPSIKKVQDEVIFRPLCKMEDTHLFKQFESLCSEEDIEGAYVSLNHKYVYGAFEQDNLVGVSSAYLWNGTKLVDIGVLVLDAYRERNIATRLIETMSRDIIDNGYVPQYCCQVDNESSIALAEAVGFSLFGKWEVLGVDKE